MVHQAVQAAMVRRAATVTALQAAVVDHPAQADLLALAAHQAPAVRRPAAAPRLAVHRAARLAAVLPASVVLRARLPVAEAVDHRAVRRLPVHRAADRPALAEHQAVAADMVHQADIVLVATARADQRVAEPMFLHRQWFCSSAPQQQACSPAAALQSKRNWQKQPDFSQMVELNLKRAARNGRPFSFSR
jgi:hypothetical protein